jgi:hypothetical protein
MGKRSDKKLGVKVVTSVPEEGSSLSLNIYDDNHENTKVLAAIASYNNGKALQTLSAIFYIMKLH